MIAFIVPIISSEQTIYPSNQTTLYVGGTGPGNYSSIQSAINAANSNDTIFVYSGYYSETPDINKSINLIGENEINTIIDGGGKGDVIYITSNHVVLSRFTIKGSVSHFAACCLWYVHNCSITKNIFMDNTGNGIQLISSNNNEIKENIFLKNNEGGIFNGGDNNSITYNHFEDNTALTLQISANSYNCLIYNNNFINNSLHVQDFGVNNWYSSLKQQGNYFDNYNGPDYNTDGIGDIPYDIPKGNNQDIYPLMNPLDLICRDNLDQQQLNSNGGSSTWHPNKFAQSFKPSVDILTRVELLIGKDGDPSGNLTISIRDDLYGQDLTNCTIPMGLIPISSYPNWEYYGVIFNFPDIPVITNQTYYIVWHADNWNASNSIIWYHNTSNPYSNGEAWFFQGSIGSWSIPYPNKDYCFKTYGIIMDVNQPVHDRGFPIRHATDGDWGAAQSFKSNNTAILKADIYLRKFGSPEFNLTVELREDSIDGAILDTLVFTPENISSTWSWFELDFTDIPITSGMDYFIICPPAPSGVTTSFGYEWGYAFGNQYDDGSFWFTRDGGNLWRDLPSMYEFVFRTYGY